MEFPFRYVVFQIFRMLYKRNMPLVINKTMLCDVFSELIKRLDLSEKEKKEIVNDLDIDYEISVLIDKYYQYFEFDGQVLVFDSGYTSELKKIIVEENAEYDSDLVYDVGYIIKENTVFLEMIGVKIKKEIYNYLLDIEREIEDCYNELCHLQNYVGFAKVDSSHLIKRIRELKVKKMIILLNTKNLLSKIQLRDLMLYACNMAEKISVYDDVTLIVKDDNYDERDVISNVFLRNIFTGNDSYIVNLGEEFVINGSNMPVNFKYSIIRFYTTFLELLEKEMNRSDDIINMELNKVKYRIMNTLDSVYNTALFMGKEVIYDDFKENFYFAETSSHYFIKELFAYSDSQYVNQQYHTDNLMIYFNNLMKKLFIETYYLLTGDKSIVQDIKDNKLYGVNKISTSFLKDIVEKPKTKIKEV